MEQVTVRVPASTSNLGPGFDCLGIALRLYNTVMINRVRSGRIPAIAAEAARLVFETANAKPFAFSCKINGDVPVSRGLGSSVTVRLGVLHGLNELLGRKLDRTNLFELCARLEGHPDNAAPGVFGGFNVVRGRSCQRFAVSARLKFVLLIPAFEISTDAARSILPDRISRRDAVESCGNACAITAAFASGRYEQLRGAFSDYLHQPVRKPLIPFLDSVIAAAESAGALGGFLSGSGSTIAAVTLHSADKIAAAMREATPVGKTRTLITTADNRGAQTTTG